MWYLILWIISLHVLGAITFYNMVDGFGGNDLKNTLNKMPNYLRVIILMLWPYIMMFWLLSGKYK